MNTEKFVGVILFLGLVFSIFFLVEDAKISGFVIREFYEIPEINIIDSYENEFVKFVVPIENKKTHAENYYSEIEIYDSSGDLISKIESEKITLSEKEKSELVSFLAEEDLIAGKYQLRAIVFSGEESIALSKNFEVEKKIISFEGFTIRNAEDSEKTKLGAIIKNHLDKDFEKVSAEIILFDDLDKELDKLKTDESKILAKERKVLETEIDSSIIDGDYSAKILIKYDDAVLEQDFVLIASEGSIRTFGTGYSIAHDVSGGISRKQIIIMSVILFSILNLAWFIYQFRKK